jgi:hypothetical protein
MVPWRYVRPRIDQCMTQTVTTPERYDPKMSRSCDNCTQNWKDCPSTQNCGTTILKSKSQCTILHNTHCNFDQRMLCDTTSPISPQFLCTSLGSLALGIFFIILIESYDEIVFLNISDGALSKISPAIIFYFFSIPSIPGSSQQMEFWPLAELGKFWSLNIHKSW